MKSGVDGSYRSKTGTCRLDSSGSGYGLVMGSFEHGRNQLVPKMGASSKLPLDLWDLKKRSAPRRKSARYLTLQGGRQRTDSYIATKNLQLVQNKLVSYDVKITHDYSYSYRKVERKCTRVLIKYYQMHKHIYLLDFKKNRTYVASKYHIIIIVISPQKWVLQLF